MNQERIQVLAKNAAIAMMDRNLTIEQINKVASSTEITSLPTEEYRQFMSLMTQYMREISREEGNEESL